MAAPEPQRGGAGQPHGAHGVADGKQGGAADQTPEGSPQGADECMLTSLPDAVVAGLWPAERVLEGFAVCSKGLSRALRSAPKVVLRGRGIEDEEMEAVVRLLEAMVRLKWLDLGYTSIGARGATALAGALRAMTGLEHLNLSHLMQYWGHREPGAEGMIPLEPCLPPLEQSKLRAGGIMALATCLPPSLLHLDLTGSGMGAQGATVLARALEAMTGLQHLAVSRNSLLEWGGVGIKALAGALPGGLLHLDLWGNSLGAEGARVLGPCLPQGLLHLTLSSNDLNVEGVKAIAPFLPPSLQYLDLEDNDMRAEGAEVLARHLPRSLLRLDVSGNELGAAGAWAIARHLPPLLELLDLSNNQIGGSWDGGEEVSDAAKQALSLYLTPRVRSYHMDDHQVEDIYVEDISDEEGP